MVKLDPDRKDSSSDDEVESLLDELEDAGPAGTRFQSMDMDQDGSASNKPSSRYVVLMCVLFLFIVEFSQFIMEPPLQQIMEDFVCHSQLPDHTVGDTQDARCKETDVQMTLAMARSWLMWSMMLVPLVVQVPYGIIADRYGRRPVLFLGLLGITLGTIWYIIVLRRPDSFSIWHLLIGSLPILIGGGHSVITAMVWTIIADSVSEARRTSLFYQLHAMMLGLSAAFRPVAAWLLSINAWLPMWIGLAALILSMLSTLLIPETLYLRKLADEERRRAGLAGPSQSDMEDPSKSKQAVIHIAWRSAKQDFSRVLTFVLGSKHIMLLILAYGCIFPINLAFEMNFLQYVTKRFGWDWSTATYFTTISKVASVVVLLVFLPVVSHVLTKRYNVEVLVRDLYLCRGSIIFVVAGNAFTAVASAPWMLVISLIVLSIGNGFQPILRSLLAGIVEPHTLATLNTTIATVETVIGLISMPALGWLLSKGIELGGLLMGLPFVATLFCALLASFAMFRFKLPQGVAQPQGRYGPIRGDV